MEDQQQIPQQQQQEQPAERINVPKPVHNLMQAAQQVHQEATNLMELGGRYEFVFSSLAYHLGNSLKSISEKLWDADKLRKEAQVKATLDKLAADAVKAADDSAALADAHAAVDADAAKLTGPMALVPLEGTPDGEEG